MKDRMRIALAYGLTCAALWLGLWGVIDETALKMAALPQEETAAPEEEAGEEIHFVFPWLEALLRAGLVDYAAMDIKNRPEKYALTCGLEKVDLGKIEKSIHLLMDGGIEYEFRTTVVKEFHEIEDIEAAAKWIGGAKRYFLQAFKDSGALIADGCSGRSDEEMYAMADRARPFVALCEVRGVG